MRFMMLMLPRGYERAAAGTMPDPKGVDEMMKYNRSLKQAGVLLAMDGLHPPAAGARISFAGGRSTVSDGPFAEAKEVVGGYAIVEAPTHADAVELATRFMELHRQHWPEFEGESEVRPFEEMGEPAQS